MPSRKTDAVFAARLLALWTLAAGGLHAQTFECVDKSGNSRYSPTPCAAHETERDLRKLRRSGGERKAQSHEAYQQEERARIEQEREARARALQEQQREKELIRLERQLRREEAAELLQKLRAEKEAAGKTTP